MIRSSKIAFLETRASTPMMVTTIGVMIIGILLTFFPFVARYLGFVTLPAAYWLYLLGILICYVVLTQIVKLWYIRRFGFD